MALACNFDSTGAGSADSGLEGSAGESGATSEGATTATTATTASGSAEGGTSSTTSPTTSASASTTNDATGEQTSDSGVESGTAGADASAGTSTGPAETSMSGDATTGGQGTDYPPCGQGDTCDPGSMCVIAYDQVAQEQLANLCGPDCMVSDDCPPPPESQAVPYCPPGLLQCVLVCEANDCPAGMMCYDLNVGPRCMWPV